MKRNNITDSLNSYTINKLKEKMELENNSKIKNIWNKFSKYVFFAYIILKILFDNN